MKKYLKYAGICALILAAISFILVIACDAIDFEYGGDAKGTDVIFAKGDCDGLDKALAGLFGFIFLLVAMVILAVGFILPLVGKGLDAKIAGILNIVAAVLLIVGGILIICTKNSWLDANDVPSSMKKYYDLTAEYAIAGILSIVAGVVALAPAYADFLDKK